MMIWPKVKDGYRKGENKELDLRYSQYKKVNLFAGRAYDGALSPGEASTLIELWNKEQKFPWTLTVKDVTKLAEFTEKILLWRRSDRRENARLRMEHAREKLKEAAKNGDENALRKVKRKRKADAVRSAAYRKRKRKERKQECLMSLNQEM